MKHSKNLQVIGNRVMSYGTHVATIARPNLIVHGHWSMTTSKHVNHVASELGLTKVDGPAPDSKEKPVTDSMFGAVAFAAKMGAFFTSTQAEKNDWETRMLKAGLANRGLIMPEDWDQLSEEVKAQRLTKVLAILDSPVPSTS